MAKQWYGPAARAERKRHAKERAYTSAALSEAERLGDSFAGAEHLLLALVAPEQQTIAARALRECGVEYDALRALFDVKPARKSGPRTHPPAFYGLRGRAEGIAVAFGAKQVEAEHLLLAMLWESHTRTTTLLEQLGTSARAVQRRLATLGARVPPGQPPGRDDTRWGKDVVIRIPDSDAWELASRLQELLPEGAPVGFNFNATSAWYRSGEGIDLAPIVRKARRQQLAERRREPEASRAK
jgi:ATP-dependent Clp protease ATP-binding subunit ClpA